MIPGLALDRLETRQLFRLLATDPTTHLTAGPLHQHRVLIRQQQHLPVAVAALLPQPLASLQIERTQDAIVQPVEFFPRASQNR